MIAVLVLGTLLGALVLAVGLRRLRDRLRAIQAQGDAAGESLAPSALMVFVGVAALAGGLSLLPFAAVGATPSWLSLATGLAQLAILAAAFGGARLASPD